MELYLIQHGRAVAEDVDPQRPLSRQGRAETERVADFIEPLNLHVDSLWHSAKTRAAQTARILGEMIRADKGIIQRDGLAPNDNVGEVANELNSVERNMMIVGHLPFLSKLASLLIAGDESADVVAFRSSGVVCLRRGDDGRWRPAWIVTPDLLG